MSRLAALLNADRPLVMGILNTTPDSFSDGGLYLGRSEALARATEMISEGADIIDIGGESTRPGAVAVAEQEEIDRVIPVIETLRSESDVAISVDTSKAGVMRAAVSSGADLINDVRALQEEKTVDAASESNAHVCLMHMQGEPRTMQQNPHYDDVVEEVADFFRSRISVCEAAGIDRQRLLLDVGFGFGKTVAHNLTLINQLRAFTQFDLPLLVGLSRKSTIGKITDDRLSGSLAGALAAVSQGAKIVRVHDVAETVAALQVWRSVQMEQLANS